MITIKAQPTHKVHAGYNQIVYVIDSTNKNKPGFRYVADVYRAGSSQLIESYEIPPIGTDGYGTISIERALQNYLSYNINKQNPNDCFIDYDIKFGEKYGSDWSYNDYEFFGGGGDYNGYTQLRQFPTTIPHSYLKGDQINVRQTDGGVEKPILEGLQTVVRVIDSYTIVIDLTFNEVDSGPTIGGVVNFADQRKIIYRNLTNITNQTATNSVVNFLTQFLDTPSYTFSGTTGTKKFLTSAPNGMRATVGSDMYFNFLGDKLSHAVKMNIKNSNGDVFNRSTAGQSASRLGQINVGPNNITAPAVITGTQPIVKPNTEWYEFKLTTLGDVAVSETFRIYVDRRCQIDYGNGDTSIMFLDRLGSFGSFGLQLRKKVNTDVKTSDFNAQVGGYDATNGTYHYNTIDAGITTIYSEETVKYEFNTNWMTEAEARYFDEVYASGKVVLKYDGKEQTVSVTDKGYETNFQRNKTLIKKKITVTPSNQNKINI